MYGSNYMYLIHGWMEIVWQKVTKVGQWFTITIAVLLYNIYNIWYIKIEVLAIHSPRVTNGPAVYRSATGYH